MLYESKALHVSATFGTKWQSREFGHFCRFLVIWFLTAEN